MGGLASVTLAKKDDVGHNGDSFAFERIRWQADSAHEVGLGGEVSAESAILFVQREMRCDQPTLGSASKGDSRQRD